MKRGQWIQFGLCGVLGCCLAASACSAGGDDKKSSQAQSNAGGSSGAGAQAANAGGRPSFGGMNPNGGDPSFDIGGGPGSGGATGAGGNPTESDGHIGPQTTANCADTSKFQGGSGANKLLYPYDGTVFPRGLGGPLFMWNAQADQILIEARSSKWSYVDCPVTPEGVRYQFPDVAWQSAASWSDGTADPVTVTITALAGGKALAPVTATIKFALTTLKGAIYYNSYGSALAANNGAVLKLLPGQPAPTLFLTDTAAQAGSPTGPCRSCHALSANGTVMTANHHTYPGTYESESYDVTGPTPTLVKNGIPEAGFAGIFPDGSRMITNGPPTASISGFFPTAPGDVTALVVSTSKMLDTRTGAEIAAKGWNAPHAQMPMFSPDGKHIVYNDSDQGPKTTVTAANQQNYDIGGHSLWVADFDSASNTFSNARELVTDKDNYLAWPFFTADSAQVVYAVDSRPDFTSQVPDPLLGTTGFPPTSQACAQANPRPQICTGRGHLMIVDVATRKVASLDLANGYKGGQSYLPGGKDRDNELEFFPTVSPIAGGGYSWALFTSRRTYGNKIVKDLEDPTTKKIWVTAIALGAPAGTDPSNPPFLLPGQELDSGNVRAFAALEPCKEDGQACSSGSECCKGHCTNIDPATGLGVCGQLMIHECSRVDDRCEKDEDCCTGPDNGVNGRPLRCIKTAGSAFCGQGGIN